jgi:mRNA interferase RelE/StbE
LGSKYEIEYLKSVKKDLKGIAHKNMAAIFDRIESLRLSPNPIGSIRLTGDRDLFRIRSGDYRILYEIQPTRLVILVVRVAHRKNVYRAK